MTTSTDGRGLRGTQIVGIAASIFLGLIAAGLVYATLDYYCSLQTQAARVATSILHHRDASGGAEFGAYTAGMGLCFGVVLLLSLSALVPLRDKPQVALFTIAMTGVMVSLGCAAFAVEAYRRGDHQDMNAHWLTGTEGEITAAVDAARESVMWTSGACSSACCCLGVLPLLITGAVLMHRSRRSSH